MNDRAGRDLGVEHVEHGRWRRRSGGLLGQNQEFGDRQNLCFGVQNITASGRQGGGHGCRQGLPPQYS